MIGNFLIIGFASSNAFCSSTSLSVVILSISAPLEDDFNSLIASWVIGISENTILSGLFFFTSTWMVSLLNPSLKALKSYVPGFRYIICDPIIFLFSTVISALFGETNKNIGTVLILDVYMTIP